MQELVNDVLSELESLVLGKPKQIKLALSCLLAKGHLLIEDLPGMGKTTLAHSLANCLGLSYQRVQFTSDMLPADVVGVSIFDEASKEFKLHQGPVFNQVVLADEINRASPKTQSALLEAMAEHNVSIDGTTHKLDDPFFVIATQNPSFHSGTFPLPESQLDRFMMRISLGFPNKTAEKNILLGKNMDLNHFSSASQCDPESLKKMQQEVDKVHTSDTLLEYVLNLLSTSRDSTLDIYPLSPRAGKALLQAAKAWAYVCGRDHVIPDDIQEVFVPVCQHRLKPTEILQNNQRNSAVNLLEQVSVVS